MDLLRPPLHSRYPVTLSLSEYNRLVELATRKGATPDEVPLPYVLSHAVFKLRVENLPNGQVRARGKAWPADGMEPDAWLIDKTDPIGNHEGAPGLFINAPFGAYLDNFSLTRNQ